MVWSRGFYLLEDVIDGEDSLHELGLSVGYVISNDQLYEDFALKGAQHSTKSKKLSNRLYNGVGTPRIK